MSQNRRLLIIAVVVLLLGAAAALYGVLNQNRLKNAPADNPQPGMIHLYLDDKFVANLSPADLSELPGASFKDAEEGKRPEGWWLRDVVRLYVDEDSLSGSSEITVIGVRQKSGETKSAVITWKETLDPDSNVIFDLAGDGQSIKLASTLERLDTRDEWIQGVNRIDIQIRPQ